MDVEERYRYCTVIADHAGGRVPVIDVEERSKVCMLLLIVHHAGGRVPVMDVEERYRFCMLLINDHS